MGSDLKEYRDLIVQYRYNAISIYEKSLLSLSTGALALSVVFVKDIFTNKAAVAINILYLAWACWVISLTLSVISFYISQLAYNKALEQIDDGIIYNENVIAGGIYTGMIFRLNTLNGISFLLGIIIFVALVGEFST